MAFFQKLSKKIKKITGIMCQTSGYKLKCLSTSTRDLINCSLTGGVKTFQKFQGPENSRCGELYTNTKPTQIGQIAAKI